MMEETTLTAENVVETEDVVETENTEEKKKRFKLSYTKKRGLSGILYLLPWIIGFLLFFAYPLSRTLYYSFNRVTFNAREGGYQYTWVGIENYKRILRVEPDLILAFQDFFLQIIVYVPVIIALSIMIALLLNQKLKGRAFFRLIFFLPVIVLNEELLNNLTRYGAMSFETGGGFIVTVVNRIMPAVLISGINLLFNTVLQVLWYCGVPILIFLATIQKIDKSLYEAASIDGASGWNIFWKITLPTVRPLISVVIVYLVVFIGGIDTTSPGSITQIIQSSRYHPQRAEGYASAQAVLFAILQFLLVGGLYFITKERKGKGGV